MCTHDHQFVYRSVGRRILFKLFQSVMQGRVSRPLYLSIDQSRTLNMYYSIVLRAQLKNLALNYTVDCFERLALVQNGRFPIMITFKRNNAFKIILGAQNINIDISGIACWFVKLLLSKLNKMLLGSIPTYSKIKYIISSIVIIIFWIWFDIGIQLKSLWLRLNVKDSCSCNHTIPYKVMNMSSYFLLFISFMELFEIFPNLQLTWSCFVS